MNIPTEIDIFQSHGVGNGFRHEVNHWVIVGSAMVMMYLVSS